MKEYLIFLSACILVGLLPRLIPARFRPAIFRSLDSLFWMLSLPGLIAFVCFALTAYVKGIGNLTTASLFFLALLVAFASYYCGALALAAGKMYFGPPRCSLHEDTPMVCPECRKDMDWKDSGSGRLGEVRSVRKTGGRAP